MSKGNPAAAATPSPGEPAAPDGNPPRLTGSGVLARNSVFNLIGQTAPMVVALFAIPQLIHGLGDARFGVLSLVWMVIGYFGLFDFGLGRALTRAISEKTAAGRDDEIPEIAWTALLLMFTLGAAGAVLLGLLAPWLVREVLTVPEELHGEAIRSFYLLALSLPPVISMVSLQGILEARQKFAAMNAIRTPISVLTYLAPLFILPYSSSLVPVVVVSLVGRTVGWLIYLIYCLRAIPALRHRVAVNVASVRPLVRFGGWLTVTNVISPLMTYSDRFLIGAMVSMAAVSYYVTPYEIITKLWIIPAALGGVLFPAFSAGFARDRSGTARLFDRGMQTLFVLIFPMVLVLVLFAREGFTAWLNADFAAHSAPVFQLLAIGVLVNCVAQVPFILLQGAGRSDITAWVHLAEFPPYVLVTWWALGRWGILGAAAVWTLRVVVDTGILLRLCAVMLPESRPAVARMAAVLALALPALGLATLPETLPGKATTLALATPLFLAGSWFVVLSADSRSWVRSSLRRFGRPVAPTT